MQQPAAQHSVLLMKAAKMMATMQQSAGASAAAQEMVRLVKARCVVASSGRAPIPLKVIIESGALADPELIRKAARDALDAGKNPES